MNQFDNKTPWFSIICFVTNIILDLNNLTTNLSAIVLYIMCILYCRERIESNVGIMCGPTQLPCLLEIKYV